MKYTVFSILFAIAGFLYMGSVKVSLSPNFSIRIPEWRTSFGFVLIIVGVVFISLDSDRRALEKLREELDEAVKKIHNESLPNS